jgi:Uma2 family endonuclease
MSIKHKISNQVQKEDYEVLSQQYRDMLRKRNEEAGIKETLEYIKEYADAFLLEGEEVSQGLPNFRAIQYLLAVLEWLFHNQNVGIVADFMFYLPGREESKISPDVAVVNRLDTTTKNSLSSYAVGEDGPAPRVVFEVASKNTWKHDLTKKLTTYAMLEVAEYFAFDPNPEQYWQEEWAQVGRLLGWSYNPASGKLEPLPKDEQGRLYSQELDSWLQLEITPQVDSSEEDLEIKLRLYDTQGHRRLTEAELRLEIAAEQHQQLLQAKELAKQEHLKAEQAASQLEVERQRIRELEEMLRKFKDKQA